MTVKIRQFNETDPLEKVIIGRAANYAQEPFYIEIINEVQKKGLPKTEDLMHEFKSFQAVLEAEGIEVLVPEFIGGFVYDQLTPRDIGVVIGEQFLICNMVKRSRRYEIAGVLSYLKELNSPIIIPDSPTCLIEGGDIMVDKGHLFVSISQRTNWEGIEFLSNNFGEEFKVVPILAKSLDEGEDVLHLDCMFNPIGKQHALIYEAGFEEVPQEIRELYIWICVDKLQQAALATNVLSLTPEKLISRAHQDCTVVNEQIRNAGIKVITLPFDGAPSTGGSFRCCSMPLYRK
ncbi:dimethylarginine dimethylaminohydrolase family protein [Pararhodonellum marinum]|uniref:dimethylarginine dimethylaminohydrolase family protein n=1 Tax=Pararhodonellum marinum TaxID=2755358 RepID=UPI00189033D2|nr:arginine deiminase family protein [Pararhodonellum marinum]